MRRLLLLIVLLTANLFAGAAPPTVADIAALKALAPGAYQTVQVLRYNSADSGRYAGGGLVNWIAGSSKAAAACSVYVPNSNPARGRWERVSSSIRSAAQCGVDSYADTISGATTYPDLAGTGTRMVVVSATGTASTQSIPAGGSLANPTGTIGLTAVNGVLTSGMRSDGAPALSQAIVPTWTGIHTFMDSVRGVAARWTGTTKSAGFISTVASALYRSVDNDSIRISGGTAGSGMNLIMTGGSIGNYGAFMLRYGASDTVMWSTPNDGLYVEYGATFTNNVQVVPNATLSVKYWLDVTDSALFSHSQSSATPYALTEVAGNIAINSRYSDFFTITLDDPSFLLTPTNAYQGRHFTIRFKQDGSGGNALTYDTGYRFPNGDVPSIPTTAGSTSYESFIYDEAAGKWDFVGNAFNLLPGT